MEDKEVAMQNYEVEDATADDAEEILDVQKVTWLATYPNEDLGITREDIEQQVNKLQEGAVERLKERILHDSFSHDWIVRDGGKIVGFIRAQKQEETNRLRALYVLPDYQRKGIGRKLMHKALEWLTETKPISLEVASYNESAINMYKKYGFKEAGSVKNEVAGLPNGKEIPEIKMIKPSAS